MNEASAVDVMREGALVVQAQQAAPLVAMPLHEYTVSAYSPAKGRILASYDMTTREGKIGVFRATQKAELSAQDAFERPIPVQHLVIHPVSIVDRTTGEVNDTVRIVLIQPDGKRLAMVSEVAYRQMMLIADILGPAPWAPPALISIKPIKTNGGYSTYELTLDPKSGPKEKK